MHDKGDIAVPVLVHLRDLEKAHDINQLVAAQLTAGGERRIDLPMFRYLLRVAVGTALAGGPPHRSQRAGLPHWAPTLGVWQRSAPPGRDA